MILTIRKHRAVQEGCWSLYKWSALQQCTGPIYPKQSHSGSCSDWNMPWNGLYPEETHAAVDGTLSTALLHFISCTQPLLFKGILSIPYRELLLMLGHIFFPLFLATNLMFTTKEFAKARCARSYNKLLRKAISAKKWGKNLNLAIRPLTSFKSDGHAKVWRKKESDHDPQCTNSWVKHTWGRVRALACMAASGTSSLIIFADLRWRWQSEVFCLPFYREVHPV